MYVCHDESRREPWFEPEDAFELFDDGLVEQEVTPNPRGGSTVYRSLSFHPQTAMEDRVGHFAGAHMPPILHFAAAKLEADRFRSDFVISFDPDSWTPRLAFSRSTSVPG